MATGYQFYKVNRFPNLKIGESISSAYQGVLLNDVDETPKSTITAKGIAENSDFLEYSVLHEDFQEVTGRYLGKPIRRYIAEYNFHIFYHHSRQILFIDSKKQLCDEFVKRFKSNHQKEFDLQQSKIKLTSLADDIRKDIRGGWFGNVQIADVSSIALFGPTVGESDEWDRYDNIGELKTLDIALTIDEILLSVKIMANRGIVIFGKIDDRLKLSFLLKIQDDLEKYEEKTSP